MKNRVRTRVRSDRERHVAGGSGACMHVVRSARGIFDSNMQTCRRRMATNGIKKRCVVLATSSFNVRKEKKKPYFANSSFAIVVGVISIELYRWNCPLFNYLCLENLNNRRSSIVVIAIVHFITIITLSPPISLSQPLPPRLRRRRDSFTSRCHSFHRNYHRKQECD